MGKAPITEEDLTRGLEAMGGFSNLGQKPRRDSPFGSEYVRNRPAETSPPPVRANPTPTPTRADIVPMPSPRSQELPRPVTPAAPIASPVELRNPISELPQSQPKSETYQERITLQMTPAMRDRLNELARTLQRKRRTKGERITPNTIMRVAIESFIAGFEPSQVLGVSSEDELLSNVLLARKGRGLEGQR